MYLLNLVNSSPSSINTYTFMHDIVEWASKDCWHEAKPRQNISVQYSFFRIYNANLCWPVSKMSQTWFSFVLCSVTLINLHKTYQLLQYKRCLLLITPSVDDDKGATKTFSSSPAQTLRHVTDAIFLIFKFTNHLKRSNADCYHQSDIVFDFKVPHKEYISVVQPFSRWTKIDYNFSVVE